MTKTVNQKQDKRNAEERKKKKKTWCLGALVAKFLKRGRAEGKRWKSGSEEERKKQKRRREEEKKRRKNRASFGQCLNACGEMGLRQTNIRLSQDFHFII